MSEVKPVSDVTLMYTAILHIIDVRKRMGEDYYILNHNINLLDVNDDSEADRLILLIREYGYHAWKTQRFNPPKPEVTGILVYWGKEDSDAWYSKHVGTIPGESYWK